ncbi:hypothetical protein [Streptomyces fractus]|uniref:hypothetical protein n=1 Tax=Streptomyces fractus TaxID=641806 RepID=UPI003CF033B8
MRYATTTEHNERLHRQDSGNTTTYCDIQALYDVDHDTATFGLMAGTLHTCRRCDTVAVRRNGAHGYRPQHAGNDDVRAAARILAQAGHEPARTLDELGGATGYLVEPFRPGCVLVTRLTHGTVAIAADAQPVLRAYSRTLASAGWDTRGHRGRSLSGKDRAFTAQRPESDEPSANVMSDEPDGQRVA